MIFRAAAEPALPGDLLSLIRGGERFMGLARALLSRASLEPTYALTEIKPLAPIPRPGKILCSGINYCSHQEENPGATLPDGPFSSPKCLPQ